MKLTRFSSLYNSQFYFGTALSTKTKVYKISRVIETFLKLKFQVCQNAPILCNFSLLHWFLAPKRSFLPILNSYFPISAFKGKIERENK